MDPKILAFLSQNLQMMNALKGAKWTVGDQEININDELEKRQKENQLRIDKAIANFTVVLAAFKTENVDANILALLKEAVQIENECQVGIKIGDTICNDQYFAELVMGPIVTFINSGSSDFSAICKPLELALAVSRIYHLFCDELEMLGQKIAQHAMKETNLELMNLAADVYYFFFQVRVRQHRFEDAVKYLQEINKIYATQPASSQAQIATTTDLIEKYKNLRH